MGYVIGVILVVVSCWLSVQFGSVLAAAWWIKRQGKEFFPTCLPVLSSLYAFVADIFGPRAYHPAAVCITLGLLAVLAGVSAVVWFAVPLVAILIFCGTGFLLSVLVWMSIFTRIL